MTTIDEHQSRLQNAIIEVLSYSAVFRHALSEDEIFTYLPIATMILAFKEGLRQLVAKHKIVKIGEFYGLARLRYPNPHSAQMHQTQLLDSARKYARIFGQLPAIESIVVTGSGAYGNATAKSDINLVVIARPHRIYIAKGFMYYGASLLRQRATGGDRAGKLSLNLFITTSGVNFRRDLMKVPEPHLSYWLISARPVYGANVWYNLLRQQPFLLERFPNYVWPKIELRLPKIGMRPLDALDAVGYRRHLRHVAAQSAYKKTGTFLRLRPDIINQNPHDVSAEIAADYAKILARHRLTG